VGSGLKPFANELPAPWPPSAAHGGTGNYVFANLIKLLKNEDGATAIEYGLIAALVAVAAIGAMTTVGTNLTGIFNKVYSSL
jgi:pilus assembly protein Flp/PilA